MDDLNVKSAKNFDGAATTVKVLRTAPMFSEKQRNFTELIPYPLIPRISIMWAFLESHLKKTADVFRIYPETRTILEHRISDLKGSFKLQSAGKTVDAEMVGTYHIMVSYLVRHSLVSEPLTQEQREALFYNLQKVRVLLSNAHGTTPAVIAVDKTDRYVADLMFMLAESVTKAVSDMSEKSWLECNCVLVSVLNVYRNRLGKLLDGFHVFINSSELGGATTPSFHAHAMSHRKDSGIINLPSENKKDNTILTKKHFDRLGQKDLDGNYINETLEEIALENFLTLAEALHRGMEAFSAGGFKRFPIWGYDSTISTEAFSGEKFKNTEYLDVEELGRFIKIIRSIAGKITDGRDYDFRQFLNDLEEHDILHLIERYGVLLSDEVSKKKLSERQRALEFCRYIKGMNMRLRFWQRYSDRVFISPASDVFAAAIMRKLKSQGVAEKINDAIRDTVPRGMDVEFSLTDYFSYGEDVHVIPAFSFAALPSVWALYGKPLMAIAEESLNVQWEKIYYLTEAYIRIAGDDSLEHEIIQKLDDLIGISDVLQAMHRHNARFEPEPDSMFYSAGLSGNGDIGQTTLNYLKYFTRSFAFARKNKILLVPGLCPRTTIIELREHGGVQKQAVYVSPIGVYTPVMKLKRFERCFGPISLMREANARFELIGNGDDKLVIQKTGGECRTKGRPVFHRDKREHLMSRPRIYEEPIVEAISETIKKYVLSPENLGNINALYFQYYMREYVEREYEDEPDISWKIAAEILFFCAGEIYDVDNGNNGEEGNKSGHDGNIEKLLLEGFSKSGYQKMELSGAYRLINVIKEARQDAIDKMRLSQVRSIKLKKLIEKCDFMTNYEKFMKAVDRCNTDERFIRLLEELGLPDNARTKEHILYIFGIRILERFNVGALNSRSDDICSFNVRLKDVGSKDVPDDVRNRLIRDNLNTISFFKLAGLIVDTAFGKVKEKIKQRFPSAEADGSLSKDLGISEYLMVELISRIIYKYVGHSNKRRREYCDAITHYYENHPLIEELLKHVADELKQKSFQTEEHWKALGSNPAEGHTGLIEKCVISAGNIVRCMVNLEKYGKPMNEVIAIIVKNLEAQDDLPTSSV
ncbi:MAG: hypothetical protein HQK89_01960 [Nitrospirae bacterium]|nr:hypothetical protein [Nitrospirota bacterium]